MTLHSSTVVETITLQTGAACGCKAEVSKVHVCGHGLQTRMKYERWLLSVRHSAAAV